MNNSFDICAQIAALCGDLTAMERNIFEENKTAIGKAAETIMNEQRRVFAKANFLRDKKKHQYKFVNGSLISTTVKLAGRAKLRAYVGFNTETLRKYPELILVEFGRPGKSPKHSKHTDKLGRKKGAFSEDAVVMPIRVGFWLARDSALAIYAEDMFKFVQGYWNGRRGQW